MNCFLDGTSLVVLCTTSRQLLQLREKMVIGSIDLSQDADEIFVFTSFNPLQKYYLVRCQQDMFVVKKSIPLCVSIHLLICVCNFAS